jgi:molecular chaperone DnaK (HSP70)
VVLLGIDFGTACTRALRWDDGADLAARIAVVPSVALAQASGFVVGEAAAARLGEQPTAVAYGLKRLLERTPDDRVAREVARRGGASLLVAEQQLTLRTAAGLPVGVDGCVAALLHQAATRAAGPDASGERPAVLALPDWYDPDQEATLREAARRAGIHVMRFIGDGVAAALWTAKGDPSERTLGVVNVGAGGTSVTIVSIDPQGVYLSSAASDRRWGGDDVTASLVGAILTKAPMLPAQQPGLRETLRQAVEAMKPDLARGTSASRTVRVATGVGTASVMVGLEQSDLPSALDGLLEAIGETAAEALDQADMTAQELDQVIVLGGMGAFGPVRGRVAEALGQAPAAGAELEHHVVLGAAYEAAILGDQAEGPLVLDGKSTGRIALAGPSTLS